MYKRQDVNHEQAGQIAANYLLDKGYRRMAFITGQENDALSQDIAEGSTQEKMLEIAREELGYVGPNEYVVYDVSN